MPEPSTANPRRTAVTSVRSRGTGLRSPTGSLELRIARLEAMLLAVLDLMATFENGETPPDESVAMVEEVKLRFRGP